MSLNNFVNGIQEHNEDVIRNIQSNGIHVQHEGGYSYTVGMTEAGLPEMITYRETNENLEKVSEELKGLYNSLLDEASLSPTSGKVGCFQFDESQKRSHFYAARVFYGNWDFETIQVEFEK